MAFPLEPEVAPIWAETVLSTPNLVRPADGFIQTGWPLTSIPPSRGFFNWVLKFASNAVTYLMAWGLPNWQDDRVYARGALVRGASGAIYMLIGSATLALPPGADLVNWRMVFDRHGFRMSRALRWTESWPAGDLQLGSGTSEPATLATKKWSATVNAVSGAASLRARNVGDAPSPVADLFDVLEILVGTTVGDKSVLVKSGEGGFGASNRVAMEFDVWPGTVGVAQVELVAGFGTGYVPSDGGFVGAVFRTDGGTYWKCVTGDGTSMTSVTTTVAVAGAAWQRMRVEWLGVATNPAGAGQMLFYINEALVATIATTIPPGGGPCFGGKRISGSAAFQGFVGPVQFAQSY